MLNWHSMSIDEVVKELDTDPNKGLSVGEAQSRLEKCGYNELKRKEDPVSPSARFSYKLKYILLVLFVITAVLSVFIPPLFRISLSEYLVAIFP
jgi:magnesium-transporting ATPase (P-type)